MQAPDLSRFTPPAGRSWANHADASGKVRFLVDGLYTRDHKLRNRTGELYFEGYIYRLRRPRSHATRCIHTPFRGEQNEECVCSMSHPLSHDAFRLMTGLGKIFPKVLAAIEAQDWPSALAMARANCPRCGKALNLNPRTAQRILAKIEPLGLAVRTNSGGWKRGPDDLDAVTRHLHSYGAGARQEEHHRQQRETYERQQEEHMQARQRQMAAAERRQSEQAPAPTLQWAMSCGQTGQRLVAWLVAVRMCQQRYRAAA